MYHPESNTSHGMFLLCTESLRERRNESNQVQGNGVTWRVGSLFTKRSYSNRLDILVATALPKYWSLCMRATKKPFIRSARMNSWATYKFILWCYNWFLILNKLPKQIETCTMYKGSMHRVCRTWVGREVHRFPTSSWREVPWVLCQTFQPQSQSLVFLSLELETAAHHVWLPIDSVHRLCPGHWYYTRLLSAWERGSSLSVHQCSSRRWNYWCW